MAKKRIFIAINLPQGVRDELERRIADMVTALPESVRFVPPEFLHFTITFLGYQTDEDIGEVVAAMQEVVPQFTPPEIRFERIAYGPPSPRRSAPREGRVGASARMIWAMTDEATSRALEELKSALEDALAERGVRFERETRKYIGHLTLARFARVKNLPDIDAALALRFTPESVDLMESRLKRSGAEYMKLTEVEFGE